MMFRSALVLTLAVAALGGASAFSVSRPNGAVGAKRPGSALALTNTDDKSIDQGSSHVDRRSFFVASTTMATTFLTATAAAQAKEERQGIEVTPFNGLIFNYRNSQFGGLDASSLNEPSISYKEFCDKLKAGEVEFVEFLAPDGDVAYATLKSSSGDAKAAPIRIGAGYPVEQHDGWSSPAFAVRTVKNAGVPYKFSVPGLSKYKS